MDTAYFMHLRNQARNAPEEDVSREEFIRRMIASGRTPEKAEFHANMTESLGSRCLISGVKIGIVE